MEKDELTLNFCKNVRALRKKHRLSKKQMGKLLGISAVSITKIESGSIPPRLKWTVFLSIFSSFGILPSSITSDSI